MRRAAGRQHRCMDRAGRHACTRRASLVCVCVCVCVAKRWRTAAQRDRLLCRCPVLDGRAGAGARCRSSHTSRKLCARPAARVARRGTRQRWAGTCAATTHMAAHSPRRVGKRPGRARNVASASALARAAASSLHSARMACIRACSAPRGAPQPPLLHAVAMHPQPADANRKQLGLWPPRACMHAPHPLPDHDRHAARPGAAQRGAGAVPGRHQLRVDTPSQVEARLAAGAVIVHHSCLNRVQRAVRAIPCEGDASCAGFAGRAWACWFVAGACCFGPRGANAHLSGASG